MKILSYELVQSGNQDLLGMKPIEIGTLLLPSGMLSVLDPMTDFANIDAEIAECRIEVPGPGIVTLLVAPAGTLSARPFATILTFSDATAVAATIAGIVDADIARIMFADTDLLAESWVRSRDDVAISRNLDLDEALERRLLSFAPIYNAETEGAGFVMSGGILTNHTGWGYGSYVVVRHDDADGNLVRIVVSYLDDERMEPIEFLDFGLPSPWLAIAA
jgi:hypothetical protein